MMWTCNVWGVGEVLGNKNLKSSYPKTKFTIILISVKNEQYLRGSPLRPFRNGFCGFGMCVVDWTFIEAVGRGYLWNLSGLFCEVAGLACCLGQVAIEGPPECLSSVHASAVEAQAGGTPWSWAGESPSCWLSPTVSFTEPWPLSSVEQPAA